MRERCRVCGRALCGTQRRWLFHPASRLSLQVLLSHAVGREVSRDGRGAEFACGKCAFMLERLYRFDTVIARIEALSLERLQRLLLEKDRLRLCIAGMYRKNNSEGGESGGGEKEKAEQKAVEARYAALLREDFTFSGLECWAEGEAGAVVPACRASEGGRPRLRCRGCAGLRVADADYEAVCRVPRKVARGACPEEPEGGSSSLESLEEAEEEEEAASSKGLEVALGLVRALAWKPVHSPRGSKLPVPVSRPRPLGEGAGRSPCPASPLEVPDLQDLWEDLYVEYLPLRVKNLYEDQLKLAQSDVLLGEQPSELNNSEVVEKINCLNATNKQLQEKLDEMTFELRSVQHSSQMQGHKIQHLNETLKSKENECQQLNDIIGEQNETVTKLQDMLHRSQLGQLQIPEGSSTLQQQQIGLLTVQNTLFSTQLEVQRLKRTQQQKDRQLLEAKKTTQLLETMLQEEQQQKEEAWKHNKELCATVQQLKTELQAKNWQYSTWERNTSLEMEQQEQKIKHLNHKLTFKEQLIQESKELLLYLQKRDSNSTSADKMVQRLQQRIKDRDAALERAVDEKFSVLEDREQELHQLRLSVKEREQDLERLHQVLSGNKVTIQDLENMLKAKDLELEHLLATYQNLQWLKEEIEAKSRRWQSEQGGIIQQLQTALHDRNKEVEVLSATLLCKLAPGQRDTVEELYFRLHKKEKIIEELLHDKSLQTIEQVTELQELLQAVSSREQQSHISSKKMVQALKERSFELQTLRQQLMSQTFPPKMNASCVQLIQKEESVETLKQGSLSNTIVSEEENDGPKMGKGVLETTLGLQKELINAKEKLELLTQKERESRLELSALQSVVDSQKKELQIQASDVEALTRSIQIKEEFIKDLQMQLVDPEEMPAIERLTQEVLMLQEKITSVELQGQEDPGNKKLQLLLALEGLVSERSQLNETLKTEKQLYSSLVKLRAHSVSSGPEHILQVELEEVQALRRQLEEALGRSLERLSRLESLHGIGGGEPERVTVLPKHAF
nr:myomegalin isoform X6 [Anolis sagrei ordinatus]